MSRGLAALDDQSPKDVPGPDNPRYFFFFAAFFFVPFLAAFFFFAIAQSPPHDSFVSAVKAPSRRDIPLGRRPGGLGGRHRVPTFCTYA